MKKKIAGIMVAALSASMVLGGCGNTGSSVSEPEPAKETGSEAADPAQEEKIAEEKSVEQAEEKEEKADTQETYDPASFAVSDVYVAPDQAPATDITGCDTFTQIVDKLEDGRGYANATIGDADALLISSGTYEWEAGKNAAIDAEIFIYKDEKPTYLATVSAGGTAYPLSVKDGNLYVGGNHFISKYLIDTGVFNELEEAYVIYDGDGNGTYYYKTCNSQFEDYDSETAQSRFDELFAESEGAEIIEFQPVGGGAASGSLPAYEYPGPEIFYSVLYKYIIDEFAGQYPQAQVSIPCPVIIAEDDSDNSDIKVYGNFWIFNYDLKDDILENTSGGSYPGCIHVKTADGGGYEVVSMDIVEDGSDFDSSAKKIFGDYYDKFVKENGDDKLREEIRAQIIANYVAANNLNITAYQDYGWDPVTLPAENIDSFYSNLDG